MRHWRELLEQALREGAWEFARSSGPGGQHVNKTESKAVWRWSLPLSYLSEEERQFTEYKLRSYLTQSGELIVSSDQRRDREMNKKDCVEKVRALFERAFYVKPPRKKTRPTRSSQKKRVESKRRRGEIKSMRGRVSDD